MRNGIVFVLGLLVVVGVRADQVLYVGDSQGASSVGLFQKLRKTVESEGHTFTGHAVCGAKITDYLNSKGVKGSCDYPNITYLHSSGGRAEFAPGPGTTQPIDSLMKGQNAVVIELGDNHLNQSQEAVKKAAQRMVEKVLRAGKTCVWIGPASLPPGPKCAVNFRKKQAVSEAIKNALDSASVNDKKCQFIDSFNLTLGNPPPSQDCLHYTNYKMWADSIREKLKASLSREPSPSDSSGEGASSTD